MATMRPMSIAAETTARPPFRADALPTPPSRFALGALSAEDDPFDALFAGQGRQPMQSSTAVSAVPSSESLLPNVTVLSPPMQANGAATTDYMAPQFTPSSLLTSPPIQTAPFQGMGVFTKSEDGDAAAAIGLHLLAAQSSQRQAWGTQMRLQEVPAKPRKDTPALELQLPAPAPAPTAPWGAAPSAQETATRSKRKAAQMGSGGDMPTLLAQMQPPRQQPNMQPMQQHLQQLQQQQRQQMDVAPKPKRSRSSTPNKQQQLQQQQQQGMAMPVPLTAAQIGKRSAAAAAAAAAAASAAMAVAQPAVRAAVAKIKPPSAPMKSESSDNEVAPHLRITDDMTPDEKRRILLERNKIAASRCRQKRKQFLQELETKAQQLKEMHSELNAQAARLRAESDILREILLGHRDCNCTKVQAYVRAGGTKMHAATLLAMNQAAALSASVSGLPPAPPVAPGIVLPYDTIGFASPGVSMVSDLPASSLPLAMS